MRRLGRKFADSASNYSSGSSSTRIRSDMIPWKFSSNNDPLVSAFIGIKYQTDDGQNNCVRSPKTASFSVAYPKPLRSEASGQLFTSSIWDTGCTSKWQASADLVISSDISARYYWSNVWKVRNLFLCLCLVHKMAWNADLLLDQGCPGHDLSSHLFALLVLFLR